MKFQHAYSDAFRGSDLSCPEASLAQQHFKDEVDINYLMERFKVTGQMPVGVVTPHFGDFTGISDYRSALDAVNAARDAFMQYPAQLRSRFGNDPAAFVEFVSDPANLEECRKLGLALPAKQMEASASGAGTALPAVGPAAAS